MGKAIMQLDLVQNVAYVLLAKLRIGGEERRDERNEEEGEEEEEVLLSKYGSIKLVAIVISSLTRIEDQDQEGRRRREEERRWTQVDLEGIQFGVERIRERLTAMIPRMRGRKEEMRSLHASCTMLLEAIEMLRETRRQRGEEGEPHRRGSSRVEMLRRNEELRQQNEEITRERDALREENERIRREKEEIQRNREREMREREEEREKKWRTEGEKR